MAYSGLGAGTIGDPYQITTVAQFKQMASASYAGSYFALMNDIDFAAETSIYITNFYCHLNGNGYSVLNIPCVGYGFYVNSGCSIENIKLRYRLSTYSGDFYTFYGYVTLSNVVLNNVEIYNDLLSGKYYHYLMQSNQEWDSTCSISNIILDGRFYSFFAHIKCTISNIKVLNTSTGYCTPLVANTYSTTIIEKFQYSKPVTEITAALSLYLITNTVASGAIIRKGFIDFGTVNCASSFSAIAAYIATNSGTTIQNVYLKGNVYSTSSSPIYVAIGDRNTDTNNVSKIFFWGNITQPNSLPTSRYGLLCKQQGTTTDSYFNSTVLTGINYAGIAGQSALTSAQFLNSANFANWDFALVWQMSTQHPVLIDVPRYTNFLNSLDSFLIRTPIRVSSTSCSLDIVKYGNTLFGVDIMNESSTVVSNKENTLQFVANGLMAEDQNYTIKGYVWEEGNKKYVFSQTYFHYYRDSAISVVNVASQKYIALNDGTNQGIFIHGTCMLGNYLYGSARNISSPTSNGCIVKALASNVAQYSLFPIIDSLGNKASDLDSLVPIGTKLFSMFVSGSTFKILVFDTLTDTYQVYSTGFSSNGYGFPSCTDGIYLYIYVGQNTICKINPAIFNSQEKYNGLIDISSVSLVYTLHYTSSIYPHTMIADSDYLYVGFGSGTAIGAYEIQKLNKSDLSLVSYTSVPKMTDDMCQNDTHLFIGVELKTPTNASSYGYGVGCCAIRKSDLRVTNLPKLHSTDTVSVTSYASLIFGNYLIDLKTNCMIYAIDISNPDNWSMEADIGQYTLVAYKMFKTDGITVLSQPINEIFLKEDGKFVGFAWGAISDIAEFELTGLNYFAPPSVSTDDSAIIDDDSVSLSGRITNTGGKTITACGVIIGLLADLSDGITFPVTPISNEFEQAINSIGYGTYYWRAYATNAEGTGYGAIKSFENTPSYTDPGSPTELSNQITVNVQLAWNAPEDTGGANIIGYKIERKLADAQWSIIVPNTDTTSTTYLDIVVPGKYAYRISAITTFSEGLPSSVIEVNALFGTGGAYKIFIGSTEIDLF